MDEFKECKYITKEEVLKFSEIINKTFIFPQEEIIYDDYVIGYVTSYQQGKTIDEINPDYVYSKIDDTVLFYRTEYNKEVRKIKLTLIILRR